MSIIIHLEWYVTSVCLYIIVMYDISLIPCKETLWKIINPSLKILSEFGFKYVFMKLILAILYMNKLMD
jgi:hypothetical protein